jgi:AraC-like DNA-binding protein
MLGAEQRRSCKKISRAPVFSIKPSHFVPYLPDLDCIPIAPVVFMNSGQYEHYAEHITLKLLGNIARLNKYTLLRTFARWKGITPYRYLETIRISRAKQLLGQGVEPTEVAQCTGFSDQSHFTNYFSKFIGFTPGQYQSIFRVALQ